MRRRGGLFPAVLAVLAAPARAAAADCNGNGVDDALDIAPAAPGFATPRTTCLEEAPLDVAAADLDGDGDRDVAVARAFGITLLSNGGDGSLRPDGEIPVGSDPTAVAAADLDGDADADLVTLNRSVRGADGKPINGSVSILLNGGEASFLPARNHAAGPDPIDLAMADLDGDADTDLAVANAASTDLSVYWNDGGGSFAPQTRVPIESPKRPFLSPQGVAAADFDHDGDLDLMTVQSAPGDEAFLLLNDGTGRFTEGRSIAWDADFTPRRVVAADVEGDGDIDLFVNGEEEVAVGVAFRPQRVLMLANQGPGTFDRPVSLVDPGTPIVFAVEDLDGDADPDLTVVARGGTSADLSLHLSDRGRFEELMTVRLEDLSPDVAAPDMNGDGLADLVAWNVGTRSVTVFQNRGTGNFISLIDQLPLREPEQLVVADIDRDGKPELVAYGDSNGVTVWRNEGRGDFSAPTERASDPAPYELMASDLDGDGDLDVAVTTLRGLNVLENVGDALLDTPHKYAVGDDLTLAVPADLDDDGDADIAAVAPGLLGALVLWNAGGLGFEKGPLVSTPHVESALDILAADADGDGDNDLVLPNRGTWNGMAIVDAHVAILENRGGAFEASRRPLDSFPLDVASGDLDGDGLVDLVLSLAACRNCLPALDPSTIVLLGDGDGGYRDERRFFTASQPLWVLAEDLEGDGAPDVIVSLQDAGEVAVLLNAGGAAFGPLASHSIDLPAISLAALDADRDGDLDLVASTVASRASAPCRPAATGALRLLPNDGRGSFGTPIVAEAPEALFSLTPADLDGDALPEVAAFGESGITVFWNVTRPPSSLDRNGNGVPDECEVIFRRGDASGDGRIDVSDPIQLLAHLHRGGPEPGCLDAADADDSGRLDLTDAVVILEYLFRSGPAPPPPAPAGAACGPDPTEPPDPLGCEASPPCG
jgi:hypothetical protein